jgi:hypothetical protein
MRSLGEQHMLKGLFSFKASFSKGSLGYAEYISLDTLTCFTHMLLLHTYASFVKHILFIPPLLSSPPPPPPKSKQPLLDRIFAWTYLGWERGKGKNIRKKNKRE